MTESEWLACADPINMLDAVRERVSRRKVALFACACYRRLWPWLTEECQSQVVALERHAADEQQPDLTDDAFGFAIEAAKAAGPPSIRGAFDAGCSVMFCGYFEILCTAMFEEDEETFEETIADPSFWQEYQIHSRLLRDILGNPFRPVAVEPRWLNWNDGTVSQIAQAIYDERAFDRMPILADALEDAGCDNADILRHCREPGEHVRGCWVIDLLLRKQ
jgi:hypothetical protein